MMSTDSTLSNCYSSGYHRGLEDSFLTLQLICRYHARTSPLYQRFIPKELDALCSQQILLHRVARAMKAVHGYTRSILTLQSVWRTRHLFPSQCRTFAVAADGRKDLFGHDGQAELYRCIYIILHAMFSDYLYFSAPTSKYRPRYSSAISDSIVQQCKYRDLYIDWACGSGQMTEKIAPHFKETLGVDKSREQLKHIDKDALKNAKFIASPNFFLEDVGAGTVDLITVAQAFHWLTPHDQFLAEVERLLNPRGGVFCIVGYTRPFIQDDQLNDIFSHFYYEKLGSLKKPGEAGCYWDIERALVDSKYCNHQFPFTMERKNFSTDLDFTTEDFLKYVRTLSGYQTYRARNPADPDPLINMKKDFSNVLASSGSDPNSALIKVKFPYFTLLHIKK